MSPWGGVMSGLRSLVWGARDGRKMTWQGLVGIGGITRATLVVAIIAILIVLTPSSAYANTYVVTSASDDGAGTTSGTLSWAIIQANANAGSIIEFNLPGGSTITLSGFGTEPAVSKSVVFDTPNNLTINPALTASSGTQVSKSGSGTLDLAGSGSQFVAGFNVSAGKLATGSGGSTVAVSGSHGATGSTGSTGSGFVYAGGTGGKGTQGGDALSIGNAAILSNGSGASVIGGTGGTGGTGGAGDPCCSGYYGWGGKGGTGGAGGAGATGTGFSLNNAGSISGGKGGIGGHGGHGTTSPNDGGAGGNGGVGGAGVAGSGYTLTNTGNISGGNGGAPGEGGDGGKYGNGGAGGVGVIANGNATIINAGTISGGLANAGNGGRADAVRLSGGGNRLTLEAGAAFNGQVVSNSGTTNGGDTLALGGSTNATFDVSQIGASGQFLGFAHYDKTGTSTWTLTGSGSQDWTISGGTLVGDATSLQGNLTDNAAVVFNQGADGAYAGQISGSGTLTKSGLGKLRLTGNNTYTGGTTIASGTLEGNSSSLPGAIVDNGALVFNEITNGTASGVSGSGSVLKTGTATLTLTGVNTYSGGTTIDQGVLVDGGPQALPGATDYAISGGELNLAGNNLTMSALSGSGGTVALGGATLTLDQASDSTYSGAIVGTGHLLKQGAGNVSLTGANTYSGGTVVNGGQLTGNTISLQGAIANNAAVEFYQLGNGTYAGDMTGTGALLKGGAGTLTLSGANTYSGETLIGDGTVVAGSANALPGDTAYALAGGSLKLDGYSLTMSSLTGNPGTTLALGAADLTVDQAINTTFSGVITGSGALVKSGAGSLTLTGPNTYSGGTRLDGGELVGNAVSLRGNIQDNAMLEFYQTSDGAYAGHLSGTGSLIKGGSATLALTGTNSYSGGTEVVAGALEGDTTSLQGNITDQATLIFNQARDGVYTGSISGTGTLVKNGSGVLILNGQSSFSGSTTVNDGSLIVGGDTAHSSALLAGAVAVKVGATLGGHGQVGSVTDAGILSPGHSIGTLTVNGDYTALPGSTLLAQVDAQGQSDLVNVTGRAALQGGTVLVQAAPGNYALSTTYTLIRATQGVTGRFNGVTDNLAFLAPSLFYTPDTVGLTLRRNDVSFVSLVATPNQRGVADALSTLGPSDALYQAVVKLNAGEVGQAFDALSGEAYAGEQTALFSDSQDAREAVAARLTRGCPSARSGPLRVRRRCGPGLWISTFGNWSHWKPTANTGALDHESGGGFVGSDAVRGRWRLGFFTGATHDRTSVTSLTSRSSSDGYHVGIYAGRHWRALGVHLGTSYAWNQVTTHRRIVFSGFDQSTRANYDVGVAQVFAGAGYLLRVGRSGVIPFVRGAYVHLHTGSFTEQGQTAALQDHGNDNGFGLSTLGLRWSWALSQWGEAFLHARGHLGWQHLFGPAQPQATLSFSGGSDFTITGAPLSRNSATLGLGFELDFGSRITLGAHYTGAFAGGMVANGVDASAAWTF